MGAQKMLKIFYNYYRISNLFSSRPYNVILHMYDKQKKFQKSSSETYKNNKNHGHFEITIKTSNSA